MHQDCLRNLTEHHTFVCPVCSKSFMSAVRWGQWGGPGAAPGAGELAQAGGAWQDQGAGLQARCGQQGGGAAAAGQGGRREGAVVSRV